MNNNTRNMSLKSSKVTTRSYNTIGVQNKIQIKNIQKYLWNTKVEISLTIRERVGTTLNVKSSPWISDLWQLHMMHTSLVRTYTIISRVQKCNMITNMTTH